MIRRKAGPVFLFAAFLGSWLTGFSQDSGKPKKFPEHTPEHQALTASSPYLGDEAFTIRNDYWKGEVTTKQGTAMRLQFFKGNTYRLFFGANTEHLPEGAKLHLHIFDSKSKEIATSAGKPGDAAVVLSEKVRKTGLYLILMRVEVAGTGEQADAGSEVRVPSVLFYGWK